jgi:hypothetical protein
LNVAAEVDQVETVDGMVVRDRAFTALEPFVGGDFIQWNDAPERTQAEVVDAFDRAIAAEVARVSE